MLLTSNHICPNTFVAGVILRVKQDLLCLVFWALLFCCSALSSFAGTWSFFWMLPLLSRLGNPSWPLANRRCYLLERILFLYWWFVLQLVLLLQFHRWAWMVFLQLGFWQWFCRPIRHLVILLAMRPLPPPGELWWSLETFGSSLSFNHWLVCVLVKRTGSWFWALKKSFWTLGCHHYLRWSSLVCRTCRLCFSIQSSRSLLSWLLTRLLLLPT